MKSGFVEILRLKGGKLHSKLTIIAENCMGTAIIKVEVADAHDHL